MIWKDCLLLVNEKAHRARRADHAEQAQKLLLKSSEGTAVFISEGVGDRKLRILRLLEAQQILASGEAIVDPKLGTPCTFLRHSTVGDIRHSCQELTQ